ncbi:SIR2 family protein [Bradyrhizobium japonicum]|uniref:SIR2 family protein n=1 Tax=Bradyrhizobium japonicum TaxID=375 RepID=UPI003517EEED
MEWKKHCYRVGAQEFEADAVPTPGPDYDQFVSDARKAIEPWLSAVFQAEHLNLLIGSGFTTAIAYAAGGSATGMSKVTFGSAHDAEIDAHAAASAKKMGRGSANIEDQFRSALAVYEGLLVIDESAAKALKKQLDIQLLAFLKSLLESERQIAAATIPEKLRLAQTLLQSFLLSCASRTASRERLHVFTTNYDRVIEHGCDLAGLRIIDRFVGALNPLFRSSRVEVDIHYNPPGIRGEPRFMEGVVRLTKLHGSLDWSYDSDLGTIRRLGIPFAAPSDHTDLPKEPIDTVMIYPNPAKDVETTAYPYAELFRDMAAATCRPNSVIVTYGYGFGDDHVNRILLDMLTIPSTHIVIIAFGVDDRLKAFCARAREAQVSLLLGSHFASLEILVQNYFPKPALDYITGRLTDVLRHRPAATSPGAAMATPAGAGSS